MSDRESDDNSDPMSSDSRESGSDGSSESSDSLSDTSEPHTSDSCESDDSTHPSPMETIDLNYNYYNPFDDSDSDRIDSDSDNSDSDESFQKTFIIRHIRSIDLTEATEWRNRFLTDFESKFGSTHPTFFRGTYNQALDEAKRDLKFLLVYLYSESHEDTEAFCRTVIISQRFIDFLTENNIIFWSSSSSSPESYRVLHQLRKSCFPYLALIVVKQNLMVVVRKFGGNKSIETLLTELKLSIEDNESGLTAARLEREEWIKSQLIRKQQDEAFAQSLRADQEKERKKLEEKSKREAQQRVQKEKQLEESRRKERLLQLRDSLVREIPSEPEPTDPNATKLAIKLPNGTRLERRFLKSQSIKYLYYFVFCCRESPLDFQIQTNFPPRDLPLKSPQLEDFAFDKDNTVVCETISTAPTFEECGLITNTMLFVNDLDA